MQLRTALVLCSSTFMAFAMTSVARADFTGQPILGPLVVGGAPVAGNTAGHADDNDGFTSGDHIFEIWNGPDDVWQVNWPGGDMKVTMTGTGGADLDLFLYGPTDYNDSAIFETTGTSNETLLAPGSPAGTYFLNVDSEALPGSYTIAVSTVPEPASLGLTVAALALIARRRSR